MKKLTILFLLVICFKSFGQETESKDLIATILKTEVLKEYEYAIAAKIDSVPFDFVVHTFVNSTTRKYKSIRNRKLNIRLSRKEKEFLVESVKNQYAENWKESDFENSVLKPAAIKPYLEKSKRNSIVYIAKPIVFRNNSVALIYMVNLYGDVNSGGGISRFGFYKKTKEGWKKWIMLIEGIYN